MRDGGRISAAIEVLGAADEGRQPVKALLRQWGLAHRFAGAKDRAWISGLVLDALRQQRSLAWRMGDAAPRARVLAALRWSWAWDVARIAEACAEEPHGPGALNAAETARLAEPVALDDAPAAVRGDFPDWLSAYFTQAFGERAAEEGQALAVRAPVDLRVNTLKATPDKALKALASVEPAPSGILVHGLRIAPAAGEARGGAVESIPAYSKGWVEVQDAGSQIAAAAAGDVVGAQVLDYCAGGGGKTLALAAAMANTGQIYAYDSDARRLSATIHRAQRAGVRNLQILSPADGGDARLADLHAKMDVVFIDAPCTGLGVWRRRPDAKWRLRPTAIEARMAEQDAILTAAQAYVKPGGRLVYVTCSLLHAENEDRVAAFLASPEGADFQPIPLSPVLEASGQLTDEAIDALRTQGLEHEGRVLRLTPLRAGTDGFVVMVLQRAAR